jgi:cell wall-associated NlpC family hydrolase
VVVKAGAVAAVAAVAAVLMLMVLLVVVALPAPDQQPGRAGVVCAPPGGAPGDPVAGFAGNQLAHAAAIVAAGEEMGAPQRAQVIAVATAMQESQLLMWANDTVPGSLQLPHDRVGSDHDSVGLFQQRGEGWGTLRERMDPATSARLFYERLLALPNWESLPLTVAAQEVQVSAFPDAYAKWEDEANAVVGSVAGIACTGGSGDPSVQAPNPLAQQVIDRALSQRGVPYVWAGGNAEGPTDGGFDCSGLMQYAFAGIGVHVPRQTQQIWATFQPALTDPAQVLPGDMILLTDNEQATGIHHVGLYLGNGRVVHAPETGSTVEVIEGIWESPYWTTQFIGAVRPQPTTDPRADRVRSGGV